MYNKLGDKMNVIICDDHIEICKEIEAYIKKHFNFSVTVCTNSKELNEKVENLNGDVQAIVLDIVLGESKNGIETAGEIHKLYPKINIIFLTAYDDIYYRQIFSDFRPYGFIAKPIQYNILNFFLQKIHLEYENKHKCLDVISNYKEYKIPVQSIMYIQSRKRVCEITTVNCVYQTYLKITDIEKELGETFIRCHQSFIINFEFVKLLEKYHFKTIKDEIIPVSKKYMQSVREYFELYNKSN